MLVEFSAPPASGKSSVAKALSEDGYKLFRRSAQGRGSALFYATLLLSPKFVLTFLHRIFFFFVNYGALSFKRKLVSAFIAAQANELKGRKSWYVRDQGYFQLGDWVPAEGGKDSESLLKALQAIGGAPDAVVFIDIPPQVVYEKLRRRGDLQKWENRAKLLGFSGALERLIDQKALDSVKYEICDIARIPYAVLQINEREDIFNVNYHFPDSDLASFNAQIFSLVDSIKGYWRPFS